MIRNLIVAHVLLLATVAHTETPAISATTTPNTLRLEEGAASPPAKIADLAWLAGYWQGDGLGGTCEEVWGKPHGDRMTGFFTLVQNGVFTFSETMVIVEENGSLALKLKHFKPDFVGWEEKDKYVTFRLVRLGEREALFSGLTFRRTGDTLAIYLRLTEDDKTWEESFTFKRAGF